MARLGLNANVRKAQANLNDGIEQDVKHAGEAPASRLLANPLDKSSKAAMFLAGR